jgi:polyferredoxin
VRAGTGEEGELNQAGFFSGVWHGWLAPLTLIAQVFDGDIRISEPNNTGWRYDFGFSIAVVSGFGSVSLVRRKKRE